MIDVAGGDDIPRKGGPGITRSDLLVINKEDLAELVDSDLDRMRTDARDKRGARPVQFLSLRRDPLAGPVADWVRARVELFRAGELPPAVEVHDHHHPPRARALARPAGCASGSSGAVGARRSFGRKVMCPTRRGSLTATAMLPASCSCRPSPGRSREIGPRSRSRWARERRSSCEANAATLAFPAAVPARQRLRARLEPGGRLAWLPEPLILAAGCNLESSVELELEAGAAAVTRELVVLGRHGEEAGRYESELRCELEGRPLLHEAVRIDGPGSAHSSPAILGRAGAFVSLALLGIAPEEPSGPGELELAGPGRVLRALAPGSHLSGQRSAPSRPAT